jgi:hypothetical protein
MDVIVPLVKRSNLTNWTHPEREWCDMDVYILHIFKKKEEMKYLMYKKCT